VSGHPCCGIRDQVSWRPDGDQLSFEITIERGTVSYEGTVAGDEMTLNVTGATGDKMTPVARRQK
jgi:hypothetical protein